MSDSFPIIYPRNAIEALSNAYLPAKPIEYAELELVIRLEGTEITARDLASYLTFIDHVYGRMDPKGLISYAHRKEGQIQISEVRAGSWDLVITQIIESTSAALPYIVLFFLLKNLPSYLRDLAGAYRDFEEARLARLRRKHLRQQMKEDDHLANLSETHFEQLIRFTDEMYKLEQNDLPGAQRTALKHVRKIEINIKVTDIDRSDGKDVEG